MMHLNEYPQAIAKLQHQLLDIDRKLTCQREQVAVCLNVIDRAIAFNGDLKNDSQRKAHRSELMETDGDYITDLIQMKKLEDVRGSLEIDLRLLTNTFSILKLERRESIARLEMMGAA